jgi:hypothetical protein
MHALLEANSSGAARQILVSMAASKETFAPVATISHITANGQAHHAALPATSTPAMRGIPSGDAASQIRAQQHRQLHALQET